MSTGPVILPPDSSHPEDASIMGFIYKGYDQLIGTKESAAFITPEDRQKLLTDIGPDNSDEVKKVEQDILSAAIEKEKKLHPEGSTALTALLQYRADGDAPDRIKDIALLTVNTTSSLGVMDKIGIFVSSVIEAFTGSYTEGTDLFDKTNMGFIERVQTRIAENGSKQFADKFYDKALSLAKTHGGEPEKQELISLIDKSDLQKIAFIKASGMVGAKIAENDPNFLPGKKPDPHKIG